MIEYYDVYQDNMYIPSAVDVPEEEAVNLNTSWGLIAYFTDVISDNTGARSNPKADVTEFYSLKAQIADILKLSKDEVPDSHKEAVTLLKTFGLGKKEQGQAIGQLKNLYSHLDQAQLRIVITNIAESLSDLYDNKYSTIVNEGVVALLLSSRSFRFRKYMSEAENITFESLEESDKDYIITILVGLSTVVNVENQEEIAAISFTEVSQVIALFKSDSQVYELFSLMDVSSLGEVSDFLMPHNVVFLFQAMYVAALHEPKVTEWFGFSEDRYPALSLISPFKVFSPFDLIKDSSTFKVTDFRNFVDENVNLPLSALTTVTKLIYSYREGEGRSLLSNDKLYKAISEAGYGKLRSVLDVKRTTPVYKALLFSLAVAKNQLSLEEFIASNPFADARVTSLRIFNNLVKGLGIATSVIPAVAYNYATLEGTTKKTSYIEWSFELVVMYLETKTFGHDLYKELYRNRAFFLKKETVKAVEKLIAFWKELKDESLIEDWFEHPFDVDTWKYESTIDVIRWSERTNRMNTNNEGESVPLREGLVFQTLSGVYHPPEEVKDVFLKIFPDHTLNLCNPFQLLICTQVMYRDSPYVTKDLKFSKLNTPNNPEFKEYSVYSSKKYNPLTLFMGLDPNFYNCCLTNWREACGTTIAAFLGVPYYMIGVFRANTPNEIKDADHSGDIVCSYLTSLQQVEVAVDFYKLDLVEGANFVFGSQGLEFTVIDTSLSDISLQLINKDTLLKGFMLGGVESSHPKGVDGNKYSQTSAEALVSSIMNTPQITKSLIGYGNMRGLVGDELEKLKLPEKEGIEIEEINPMQRLYGEVNYNPELMDIILGRVTVEDANSLFSELHITFEYGSDDSGNDPITFQYTYLNNPKKKIDVDVDSWGMVRYAFSLLKSNTFIPWEGAVYFHTNAPVEFCEDLLIPDWMLEGKSLTIDGNKVSKKQLLESRTPKKGAFVNNTRIL